MLQCHCISETLHIRQGVLMLPAMTWKECPALKKDAKALISVCPKGCWLTHHSFCAWDCNLCLSSAALTDHAQVISSCLSFLPGVRAAGIYFYVELANSVIS